METTKPRSSNTAQAGWRYDEYARLIGISRAYLYTLPPELQPRSVKFGSRRVIIELPAEYLARIAALRAQRGVAA